MLGRGWRRDRFATACTRVASLPGRRLRVVGLLVYVQLDPRRLAVELGTLMDAPPDRRGPRFHPRWDATVDQRFMTSEAMVSHVANLDRHPGPTDCARTCLVMSRNASLGT